MQGHGGRKWRMKGKKGEEMSFYLVGMVHHKNHMVIINDPHGPFDTLVHI